MYLSSDDYRPHTKHWAEQNGLSIFHHRLEPTKEPFTVVDEDAVVQAIEDILGKLTQPPPPHLRTLTGPPPPSRPQTRATCQVSITLATHPVWLPPSGSLTGPLLPSHVAVLVHDNKGRLLPSILASLLRRLSHWSYTAVLQEYRSFLPAEKVWTDGEPGKPEKGRERAGDLEVSPAAATARSRRG